LDKATYAEAELVENRVPVLLFGGTPAERQAWAEETASLLGGTPTVVTSAAVLASALAQKQGVVYVADALSLGDAGQQQLVVCLLTQEERPKLVVAVANGGEALLAAGGLRPDLHYRLRLSQIDLDAPGLRETIAKRRARRPVGRTSGTASRRRPPSKGQHSRPKSKRPPAKRSRR
jgi:integrase